MFKYIANFLHRTPWWALVMFGLGALVFLGVFATPIKVIKLERSGDSAEMNRAIKREIESAFGESALGVAENLVSTLHQRTSDPESKQELERALKDIAEARKDIRSVNHETRDAIREAEQEARNAAREALLAARESSREIAAAVREARRTFKQTGVADTATLQQLQDALTAAKETEAQARSALAEVRTKRKHANNIVADTSSVNDKPLNDIQPAKSDKAAAKDRARSPAAPTAPGAASAPAKDARPLAQPSANPDVREAPPAPLSPELREDIRNKVTQGIYRLGVGSAMILLFIPLFIILIVSKIFVDRSRAALRLAELRKKEAEYHNMNRQVTEAKLQALQAQVEPHFLYNTLANVQALTESDPSAANQMIEHLIQYLRSALPKMRETTSTVGQEMELVRAYLNILKMRMGTRLQFDIALPPQLIHEAFPPLMLPSLVENAIKHGLEPLREGGRIDIAARLENGRLVISVRDNGKGLVGGASSGGGIGLANVRERLQALFGEAGRLVIEENSPHGVVASIEIPQGVCVSGTGAPTQSLNIRASAQAANLGEKSEPKTWWRRLISALATTERVWRRVLSWSFALYVGAAALACIALLAAIYSGSLPVTLGTQSAHGIEAMGIATLGVLLLFVVLVMTGALLTAVGYGLGALFLALLIFVPLVTIAGMSPVLVPIAIVVFVVWWWLRRGRQKKRPGDNHEL